jgi:tRNA-splicing ligase RtcB
MNYHVYRDGNIEKQIGAKVPIKRWTLGVEIEQQAEMQLHNVANLPFIDPHGLAVMPDAHCGIGATIGSVIPTINAIIPAACGVDIGCGCDYELTTLKYDMLPKDLLSIREALEDAIPHGFYPKEENDKGSWRNIPTEVCIAWEELEPGYKDLVKKHPKLAHKNPISQLGTLGSNNHYYEIVVDDLNRVGISLHSGSRGPGNKIGQYFIDLAKSEMKRWFIELPDVDLAFLPKGTDAFNDYMQGIKWAQRYAQINRELMRDFGLKALKKSKLVPKFERDVQTISCHHNYIAYENHFGRNVLVTRKGAINADLGRLAIIPGSMGAKTYIVKGLGNEDAYKSASHGAGRKMSRTQAMKTFTVEDHIKATEGIECKKDSSVLDETPGAYKNIEDVMNAQKDLVEIQHELRQIVCVKG